MKKIGIIFWLTLVMSCPLGLIGQGIEFSDEYWEEALDRAAEENKFVFVDCYTTWCSPCKKMDKQVFPVDSVGEFYNQNFINLKIDMETKEGKSFAQRYKITAYPTYLILNLQGDVMVRSCGYQPAGKFLKFGKSGLNAEESLSAMQQRYSNWDRNPEFLYNYFKVLQAGCFPMMDMLEEHLNGLSPIEMAKSANWRMFNEFVFNMEIPATQQFLSNPEVFAKIQGKKMVFDKAIGLYHKEMSWKYGKVSGKNDLNDLYSKYKQQFGESPALWKEALLTLNELYHSGAKKEIGKYNTLAKELIKKRGVSVPAVMNDIGIYYLKNIDDTKQLKEMANWIKPIYSETENPMFYATYAAVLYRLGEQEKAAAVEAEMMTLGEELGSNLSYLKEKLEEYRN